MNAPRLLTVLFTDLVGSTETVARLGPEAGQAWRLGHLDLLREALASAGGREVQAFGDGLLVVFETASAAVACAASMQRRVARANARRDALAETAVRIGLAVGEATEDAQGVHGLVVVEAARLCAAAKGGQILASAWVEALSGGRAKQPFTSLGALELKGLPAPVAAVEVEWREASGATPIPFPPALAEATRLAFVGRAAEREKLAALWQRAQAGERTLALIAGEPGIGKTRLAAELARSAAEIGASVVSTLPALRTGARTLRRLGRRRDAARRGRARRERPRAARTRAGASPRGRTERAVLRRARSRARAALRRHRRAAGERRARCARADRPR